MPKYNGSGILLYADGVEIAAQKGVSLSANVNLFDTTNKQSLGWAEHGQGTRSSDVSFEALQSTTGLSASALFDYISLRKSLMLVVTGFANPIVMEVDCSSMTINAPTEEAVGLSGSFKAKGRIFNLSSGTPNLITDPDGQYNVYDTLTISGISITSAINIADQANCLSNTFDVISGSSYRVFLFLTLNSGGLPNVSLFQYGATYRSNNEALVAGLNVITLTATTSVTVGLRFENGTPSNFSTSNIYLMKV